MTISAVGQADDSGRAAPLSAACRQCDPLHVGGALGGEVGGGGRIQAATEECGRKLRVLRTDNGGEFTAVEFAAYYADEGVTRHFSAPYTPQQNEVVVWRN